MSETKLSAVLELKDQFSATIERASKGFRKVAGGAKEVTGAIKETTGGVEKFKDSMNGVKSEYKTKFSLRDDATRTLQRVKTSLSGIHGKIYTATVAIRHTGMEKLRNLGSSVTGSMLGTSVQMAAGAGIGFGMYSALSTVKDFEAQMKRVQGISGASQEDFVKLTMAARKSGAESQFTATESAKALEYMAMAGWKTNEMMSALPGVMSLAAASGEDLAQVSDIVTDAMTAFHMGAEQATEFADVLAAASSNSNTNVGKMGYTFKYVAPLAGAMGYTIQDMAVGIGAMADAGIKGEQAGTSLRSLLTNMAAPTSTSAKAMEALGLSIKDDAGNMKSFRTVMTDLRKAFGGLTQEQKAQYASMLAGQEGMSGLIAIVDKDEDAFQRLVAAIDNSKDASRRMAGIMNDNLAGDLKQLSSRWDEMWISILSGSGSNQLRNIVQEATNLIKSFTDDIKEHGLGVKTFFNLIGRFVKDTLKAVYEFDGSMGAWLATGTTMVALKKMYDMAKGIRGLFRGGSKGGSILPSGTGSSVGEMAVNAGVVNVYGSQGGMTSGGAGNTPISTKAGGKWASISKWGGRIAMIGSVAYGIYDVATSDNKGEAFTKNAGGIAGGFAGAKAGAMAGGAIGSAFGGIGAVPGATIGGIIGGIGGYMGGEMLGEAYYKSLDSRVAYAKEKANEELNAYKDTQNESLGIAEYTTEQENMMADARSAFWGNCLDSIKNKFKASAEEQLNAYKESQDETLGVAQYTADQEEMLASKRAQAFREFFESVAEGARSLGETLINALTGSLESVKGSWQGIGDWFSKNVFSPIQNGAQNILSAGASFFGGGEKKNNATGTTYFEGGLTYINERGQELLQAPTGTKIYPAETTERIIRDEASGLFGAQASYSPVSVNVSGNTFVVREEADIDKIAHKISQAFLDAQLNYGGV